MKKIQLNQFALT